MIRFYHLLAFSVLFPLCASAQYREGADPGSPCVSMEECLDMPHDQYSLSANVTQHIWDGGVSSSQREAVKTAAEVQRGQTEVSLYSIRSRVQNVYLGILLLDEQISQNRLLISNYSDNAQQAMFIMMFFVLIFMLMSGVFTPVSSMPDWARAITYANPLRYFADAMRSVFLKGSSIADVWYDAAGLLAIGSLALTWAIISYRKTS